MTGVLPRNYLLSIQIFSQLRPWERLSKNHLLFILEPFTASNGLLTHTLKVRESIVAYSYLCHDEEVFRCLNN
jgi:hypothetical protein